MTGVPCAIGKRLGVVRDGGSEQRLDEACTELASALDGLEVTRSVENGAAAEVLLEAARNADLLVVGTRGHGGFTGLLLGSVSHQLASHSPCPIAIVPSEEAG